MKIIYEKKFDITKDDEFNLIDLTKLSHPENKRILIKDFNKVSIKFPENDIKIPLIRIINVETICFQNEGNIKNLILENDRIHLDISSKSSIDKAIFKNVKHFKSNINIKEENVYIDSLYLINSNISLFKLPKCYLSFLYNSKLYLKHEHEFGIFIIKNAKKYKKYKIPINFSINDLILKNCSSFKYNKKYKYNTITLENCKNIDLTHYKHDVMSYNSSNIKLGAELEFLQIEGYFLYKNKYKTIIDEIIFVESDFTKIPKGFIIKKNLTIIDSNIKLSSNFYCQNLTLLKYKYELPNNLNILENLDITDSSINIISPDITFKNLVLKKCNAIIPENTIIRGSLYLSNWERSVLPNITIQGDLSIVECSKLKKIKQLNVKGNIYIEKCNIMSLPQKLIINKSFVLKNNLCKLKKLPKEISNNNRL